MKSSSKWALLGAGMAGTLLGVIASGFPRRVGVSRADANTSLPGDMVVPTPVLQADRAVAVRGEAKAAWDALSGVAELYEHLWRRPLQLVFDEPEVAAAWVSEADSKRDWQASVAACLITGADGEINLHVRERFAAGSGRAAKNLVYASAFMSLPMRIRIKNQIKRSKAHS